MDKRQKEEKERDIRHRGEGEFEDKTTVREIRKEKRNQTRIYFKERIFYSKNEFAHLNEEFHFLEPEDVDD